MASAKRELFKSPDVCQLAGLQPYVLRSWEAEFPGLGQMAASGGGRLYRREDVEQVLRIKQLVFVEGLTLAGARRRLEEDASEPSPAAIVVGDVLGDLARTKLRLVRSGLEDILQLLSRNTGRAPELQLVAPTPAARRPREKAAKLAGMAERVVASPAVRKPSAKKRRAS
jgi:DNA-binding transcriptional MerR regulator